MRVATDIGGTFTDLVYLDEGMGSVASAKADTTPPHFERGVMDVLGRAGIDGSTVESFVHGTTVIINALTDRSS